MALRALAARQGGDSPAARFNGFFPTPALSLGERVKPALRKEQSRTRWHSAARCALCPLPGGEGQGEGELRGIRSRVLDYFRKCRTGRVLRQSGGFPKMTTSSRQTSSLA